MDGGCKQGCISTMGIILISIYPYDELHSQTSKIFQSYHYSVGAALNQILADSDAAKTNLFDNMI